ncbi:MAG: hypothetical protein KGZ84_04385 [Erysipelotrichia bacterium]|jgi:copper chaperone CopZ|nr:hypothetical protein [Erysipelotrichia bacterium]
MKHILFVKGLKTQDDVRKVTEALQETQLEFEVSLSNQAVIVHGRNDLVRVAKVALLEAGYIVD